MNKSGFRICSVVALALGFAFLTGCDLLNSLGIGAKKQNNVQPQAGSNVSVASPTQASQDEVSGPLPTDALVRIGNWTLTTEEFNDRLNLLKQQLPNFKEDDANSKAAVLDELVRQQLLVKEAKDSDIGDSKEIKDAVEDFRNSLLVQELASRLTKGAAATEDDARTYYDTNKSKFVEPVKWSVREIVVGDETTAKNILVQILQGGDFAQIASAQSKAADAAEGGKLKPFYSGNVPVDAAGKVSLPVAPFDDMQTAIADLDTGGISGVFKGPEGYYIVKVDSKTGGTLKPFEDFKERLIYLLTAQKQQAILLNHLRDLAEKYKPEYNKDLIDQVIGKTNTP